MPRCVSRLFLVLALLASLGFLQPLRAHAVQRVVGFGGNLAFGTVGATIEADGEYLGSLPPVHPYLELLSPELRIHPVDALSIDIQWNVMWMLKAASWDPPSPSYVQATYLHFHVMPFLPLNFSIAPMFRFAVNQWGFNPTVGGRIGLELNSPFRKFCFGIHLRPAAQLITDEGITLAAPELILELTWTWFATKG